MAVNQGRERSENTSKELMLSWVVSGHQVTPKAVLTKSGCQFTSQSKKSCGVSKLIVSLLIKSGKSGLQIQHSLIFMLNRKSLKGLNIKI